MSWGKTTADLKQKVRLHTLELFLYSLTPGDAYLIGG